MKIDYMDKKTTNAIKGIALIFMFIHHFFTFPEWYISGISYPELSLFVKYFCMPLKICVAVFAFLTGYFYFFAGEKTLHYSVKKITDVLISYWAVFIPFLVFAIATGCYQFDFLPVVYELFALNRAIMIFCWYVVFYCCTMLLLPLLTRISTYAPIKESVILLIFPVFSCVVLSVFCKNAILQETIRNLAEWFPCVAMGYLCSKYNLFNTFDEFIESIKTKIFKILLIILLICAAVLGRYICTSFILGYVIIFGHKHSLIFTMDIVYAPIFVYALAKLLQLMKTGFIVRILDCIGKKSLLMWFLHCIFFNVCSEKTQHILYFPKNPVFVVLFGLLLCYVVSVLVDFGLRFILEKKNKLLDSTQRKLFGIKK